MKCVAISQSNYLPWKGYFDLIASVDEFVIYDCVQYTRRDWRNRNKIKWRDGSRWITVPVQNKGKYTQTIAETQIDGTSWCNEHLATIRHAYGKARAFDSTYPWIRDLLGSAPGTGLSALNRHLLCAICERLGIRTVIHDSAEFEFAADRTQRLVDICSTLNATQYVSGPAAKNYLDESAFARQGISVCWKSYAGYLQYDQPFPPFEHGVSIIDLIMCTGADAPAFIRSADAYES